MKKAKPTFFLSIIILCTLLLSNCRSVEAPSTVALEQDTLPPASKIPAPLTSMTVEPPVAAPMNIETGLDIELADLPAGFLQIPQTVIGAKPVDLSGRDFSNHNSFLFFNMETGQIVTGFTTLLKTDEDNTSFENLIENPERAIQAFSDFFGATKITQEPDIQGLDLHADAQSNMQITLDIEINATQSLSYKISQISFRTGELGIHLLEIRSSTPNPPSVFPDHANRIGKRVSSLSDVSSTLTGLESTANENAGWVDPGTWLVDQGYQKVESGEIGISEEEWKTASFSGDSYFVYRSSDQKRVIVGTVDLLESYEELGMLNIEIEKSQLDMMHKTLDPYLENFIILLGGENMEKIDRIYNTEEAGALNFFENVDLDSGQTASFSMNDDPYHAEMLSFREDNMGFFLFMYEPEPSSQETKQPSQQVGLENVGARLILLLNTTMPFRSVHEYAEIPDATGQDTIHNHSASQPADINFEKLLPGFQQTPQELINATSEQLSGQSFTDEKLFHLYGENQDIVGFTIELNSAENIDHFNVIMDAPKDATKNMMAFYEARSFETDQNTKAFGNLGESQEYTNTTIHTPRDGKGLKLEMLAFEKAGIGYYILSIHSAFYEGSSIFPGFGTLLAKDIDEQIASLTATPTPENRPGVTITPTATPYVLPESTNPLLAWLEPGKTYIPLGYQRVALEEIRISAEEWQELGLDYDTLFIYRHPDGPRIILGYNVLLETYQDIGKFDAHISDLDPLLEKLAAAVGAISIREQVSKEKSFFSLIDCDKWRSLMGDINGVPYRFQLVKVRSQNVGFLIFTIEPPAKDDLSDVYDFTHDACIATTSRLFQGSDFRSGFPVYKITPVP